MGARYFKAIIGLMAAVVLLIQAGCTGLKPFPQAARGGDTIALALGSADGMSRANTSAVFVSDSDTATPYDITGGIRGIFRLYADKASSTYAPGSNTHYIIDTSGHEPWVTVMVVDLPQGLPVGTGKVKITTSAAYPTIGSHINDKPIDLEILPGTGVVSDLAYEFGTGASLGGDLTLLEPQSYAQVMPPFPESADWPRYGAIEMKLHVPVSTGTGIRVVADDLSTTTLSKRTVLYQRDLGNEDLTVLVMDSGGRLRSYESRFSMVLNNSGDPPGSFSAMPVITSVNYYDVDGNPQVGPQPADFTIQIY